MAKSSVEVFVTGHSHSARRTLEYIDGSQRAKDGTIVHNVAHHNSNGVTKRNYLVAGIDCRTGSVRQTLHDFNRVLKKKPSNKVQTCNIVMSFGKALDWDKPEDRYEAYTLARKFTKRAFPHHMAIIAEQQDNQNKMAHIHIIVNAISEKAPYYTIPGGHSAKWYRNNPNAPRISYNIRHLRRVTRDCIKSMNSDKYMDYRHGFNHHIKGLTGDTRRRENKQGFQRDLSDVKLSYYQRHVYNAVVKVLSDNSIDTKSKFRNALKQYNVKASFKRSGSRRHRKRGKRRSRRRYRRAGIVFRVDTKNGHVVPIQRGLKKTKGIHRHYIKASVLARKDKTFSYKEIGHILKEHHAPTPIVQTSSDNEIMQSMATPSSASSSSASSSYSEAPVADTTTMLDNQMESDYIENESYQSSLSASASVSASNSMSISAKSASKASSAQSSLAMSVSVSRASSASYSASVSASKSTASFNPYARQQSYVSNALLQNYQISSEATHSLINSVSSEESIAKSSLSSTTSSNAQAVQSYHSAESSISSRRSSASQAEVTRVSAIMTRIHDEFDKHVASFDYQNAIQAKCVGYDGTNKVFAVPKRKTSFRHNLHELINPIVRGFKRDVKNGFKGSARWIVAKYDAGVNYFKRTVDSRASLMDVAINTHKFLLRQERKHIARRLLNFAKKHMQYPYSVAGAFDNEFHGPALNHSWLSSSDTVSSAKSSNSKASAVFSTKDSAIQSTNLQQQDNIFKRYSVVKSSLCSQADVLSSASFALTPAGQSSISASQSASASHAQSVKASSASARASSLSSLSDLSTSLSSATYQQWISAEISADDDSDSGAHDIITSIGDRRSCVYSGDKFYQGGLAYPEEQPKYHGKTVSFNFRGALMRKDFRKFNHAVEQDNTNYFRQVNRQRNQSQGFDRS